MRTVSNMDELERISEYIHINEMFRLLINKSTEYYIKGEFILVEPPGNYLIEEYNQNKVTIRFNKQPYISTTEKKYEYYVKASQCSTSICVQRVQV